MKWKTMKKIEKIDPETIVNNFEKYRINYEKTINVMKSYVPVAKHYIIDTKCSNSFCVELNTQTRKDFSDFFIKNYSNRKTAILLDFSIYSSGLLVKIIRRGPNYRSSMISKFYLPKKILL